jgi:hypothetical protein
MLYFTYIILFDGVVVQLLNQSKSYIIIVEPFAKLVEFYLIVAVTIKFVKDILDLLRCECVVKTQQ